MRCIRYVFSLWPVVVFGLSAFIVQQQAVAQTEPHSGSRGSHRWLGPPLPPERQLIRLQARHLLSALIDGRLRLFVPEREQQQLRNLERDGIHCWPQPASITALISPRQRYILEGTAYQSLSDSKIAMPTQSERRALTSRHAFPSLRQNALDAPDAGALNPCMLPPSPLLLRMLTTLASHSSPTRPLEILSLLRPPYRTGGFVHVGAANPHSLGLAVDISRYGGYAFLQQSGEVCVRATLALLRDLPPGRYRLGVPKAPEISLNGPCPLPAPLFSVLMPALLPVASPVRIWREGTRSLGRPDAETHRAPTWPFYPAPEVATIGGLVAGEWQRGSDNPWTLVACVTRFRNEEYEPEKELADPRLKKALTAARARGVDVIALFPDGPDHLHVDVRQNP